MNKQDVADYLLFLLAIVIPVVLPLLVHLATRPKIIHG